MKLSLWWSIIKNRIRNNEPPLPDLITIIKCAYVWVLYWNHGPSQSCSTYWDVELLVKPWRCSPTSSKQHHSLWCLFFDLPWAKAHMCSVVLRPSHCPVFLPTLVWELFLVGSQCDNTQSLKPLSTPGHVSDEAPLACVGIPPSINLGII
jgi:hypothetical protein